MQENLRHGLNRADPRPLESEREHKPVDLDQLDGPRPENPAQGRHHADADRHEAPLQEPNRDKENPSRSKDLANFAYEQRAAKDQDEPNQDGVQAIWVGGRLQMEGPPRRLSRLRRGCTEACS